MGALYYALSVLGGLLCGVFVLFQQQRATRAVAARHHAASPRLFAAASHPLAGGGPLPYSCASLRRRGRGEYPLPVLLSLPRLLPGNLSRINQVGGPSSLASPACPMYVTPTLAPGGAPLGAQLLSWATAFAAAENFGATFLHAPFFDGGSGAPAPRGGWDAALGLGDGEDTPAALAGRLAAGGEPAPRIVELGGWGGVAWDEDAFRRGAWWGAMNAREHCGAVLRVPAAARVHDATWLTKGAMALRFERARALRAVAREDPSLLWDEVRDVNVAVHVRRRAAAAGAAAADGTPFPWDGEAALRDEGGVWYPTREDVLARVVRDTVVPALVGAGVPPARVVVHVFSEWEAEADFPALRALAGAAGGVRVAFWLGATRADAWTAFFHLTQADVLVGSASHFSFWAAHLSSKPLVLAQEDMDRWRLCGEGSACCFRDGRCSWHAEVRMREAARRLAALIECGGMEEEEEEEEEEEGGVAEVPVGVGAAPA
jgi:hypothetical protein